MSSVGDFNWDLGHLPSHGHTPQPQHDDVETDGNYEIIYDKGVRIKAIYIDKGQVVDPKTIRKIFTEYIETEFAKFIDISYKNTIEGIDNQIETHKNGLKVHLNNKIEKATNNLFEEFLTSKIEKKFEQLIEDKLITILDNMSADVINEKFEALMKKQLDSQLEKLRLNITKEKE